MAEQPLFLAVKGEVWFPSLKKPLGANGIESENCIQISQSANQGIAVEPDVPNDHTGDVWLFGHGMSNPKKSAPFRQYGIFYDFNSSTGKGHLFDTEQLLTFLAAIGTIRLFLFACYQGKYLNYYLNYAIHDGNRPILRATGLLSSAQRAAGSEMLVGYFNNPAGYKFDTELEREGDEAE